MWCSWNMNGFFGWLTMILFWVAIVALVVWVSQSTRNPQTRSTALDVLDNRYAAGEINDEEFKERRRLLDKSPGAGS